MLFRLAIARVFRGLAYSYSLLIGRRPNRVSSRWCSRAGPAVVALPVKRRMMLPLSERLGIFSRRQRDAGTDAISKTQTRLQTRRLETFAKLPQALWRIIVAVKIPTRFSPSAIKSRGAAHFRRQVGDWFKIATRQQ